MAVNHPNVLAVIPARGGSTELRRKNLLVDGYGVPLVLASARAARDAGFTVVISTDDPEVRSLALIDGHHVHARGPELAVVPVDEVVAAAAAGHDGPVLLVQPTVQPVTADLLGWFESEAATDDEPAALGVETRHLTWLDGQLVTDRVERQSPATWPVREVGVRWWPAGQVGQPPVRVITTPEPVVDIDTVADYQQIRRRLNVGFLLRANKQVGAGHLHRVLTLAEGLQHHHVSITVTDDTDQWAVDRITDLGWPMTHTAPDVWVYDRLDSVAGWRPPTSTPFVVLEDRGPGIRYAAAAVNAMYGDGDYTGAKYAVLRTEFTVGMFHVRQDAAKILVLFGGTDPANLTGLTEYALKDYDLDVIRPGDNRAIAAAMYDADLLITSGGRTVFEAAAIGIPAIVMCQNQRELTHTHLGVGNIDLGLGRIVRPETLRYTVAQTMGDYELRRDMHSTGLASIDGHGADRIRRIIEHVGLYGEKP